MNPFLDATATDHFPPLDELFADIDAIALPSPIDPEPASVFLGMATPCLTSEGEGGATGEEGEEEDAVPVLPCEAGADLDEWHDSALKHADQYNTEPVAAGAGAGAGTSTADTTAQQDGFLDCNEPVRRLTTPARAASRTMPPPAPTNRVAATTSTASASAAAVAAEGATAAAAAPAPAGAGRVAGAGFTPTRRPTGQQKALTPATATPGGRTRDDDDGPPAFMRTPFSVVSPGARSDFGSAKSKGPHWAHGLPDVATMANECARGWPAGVASRDDHLLDAPASPPLLPSALAMPEDDMLPSPLSTDCDRSSGLLARLESCDRSERSAAGFHTADDTGDALERCHGRFDDSADNGSDGEEELCMAELYAAMMGCNLNGGGGGGPLAELSDLTEHESAEERSSGSSGVGLGSPGSLVSLGAVEEPAVGVDGSYFGDGSFTPMFAPSPELDDSSGDDAHPRDDDHDAPQAQ